MKYFTPERLFRLQDRSDEQQFLAALDDWEVASRAYRQHLGQIGEALPPALRRLVHAVALHDARVIDLWPPRPESQRARFTIILQPESDLSRRVVLRYSLLEPPQIDRNALGDEACSRPLAWLYDELGVEPSAPSQSGEPTLTHRILFSNGWEVGLRFRKVTVERPSSLIEAASEGEHSRASRSA